MSCMVSATFGKLDADLIRLDNVDASHEIVRGALARRAETIIGSYLEVMSIGPIRPPFTLTMWVWPTSDADDQVLVEGSGAEGFWRLTLKGGRPSIIDGEPRVELPKALRPREWYAIELAVETTRLALAAHPWSPWLEPIRATDDARSASEVPLTFNALRLGADRLNRHGFAGKIESPRLWRRSLSTAELQAVRDWRAPATGVSDHDALREGLVGDWFLGLESDPEAIRDLGPNKHDGTVKNGPARAVTGHLWRGRTLSFGMDPDGYGAIHLHRDDLDDAGWQPSFDFTVPEGAESGLYGVRVADGSHEDLVPLVVPPPQEAERAPIAFLVPTVTYIAYANMRWDEVAVRKLEDQTVPGARLSDRERQIVEHPELGPSLYDLHHDGSPTYYSSRLRPILELREDYRSWMTDAPRHFSADLELCRWLRSIGAEYDVVSDEELHHEGYPSIRGYDGVLTGGHPEYVTEPMLDALAAYQSTGGGIAYLGGNGFYWATSIDPRRPHVIEVRRGHSGTRPLSSLPGEVHHATTGEPGGLWRHRGRPPNQLVGVGFTAQGWLGAAGYAINPDAREILPWLLEGVEEDPIGEYGALGGAAADEIDRVDEACGSPASAVVVGSSAGRHSDGYQGAIEDAVIMTSDRGGTTNAEVRADLIYAEMPTGGWVFSVGSIAWTLGLLEDRGFSGPARLLWNLLMHKTRLALPAVNRATIGRPKG